MSFWQHKAIVQPAGRRTSRWCRDESGASAVEFALIAPIVFFAVSAVVDLGLAEFQRMTIDHALRAGAQSAMADPGQAVVLAIVQNTASKNFVVIAQPTAVTGALSVDVQRSCACPSTPTVVVACSTTCTASAPTFIYYRITGTTIYSGMIMPAMTLAPTIQVQVR